MLPTKKTPLDLNLLPERLMLLIQKRLGPDESPLWIKQAEPYTPQQLRNLKQRGLFFFFMCVAGPTLGLFHLNSSSINSDFRLKMYIFIGLTYVLGVLHLLLPLLCHRLRECVSLIITTHKVMQVTMPYWRLRVVQIPVDRILQIRRVEKSDGLGQLFMIYRLKGYFWQNLLQSLNQATQNGTEELTVDALDDSRSLEQLIRQQAGSQLQFDDATEMSTDQPQRTLLNELPEILSQRLAEELEAGESVVWLETPVNKHTDKWPSEARTQAVLMIAIGVIASLAFLGMIGPAIIAHRLLLFPAFLSLAIGLIALIGGIIAYRKDRDERAQPRQVVYVMTDRRVIVWQSEVQSDQWASYTPSQMTDMQIKKHKDGLGSLIFLTTQHPKGSEVPHGLLGITNAYKVVGLIQKHISVVPTVSD